MYTVFDHSRIRRELSRVPRPFLSCQKGSGAETSGIPCPKPVEQPDRAGSKMATGPYTLPPPTPLEIHSDQAGEKWKRFKRAWDSYALATGLSEKAEDVQVAALLTVIGEEAREVYSTFTGWAHTDDHKRIQPVLEQFGLYCEPRKNIPFERYRFNCCCQEAGESYDQYRTALRKLAENCDFGPSPQMNFCVIA